MVRLKLKYASKITKPKLWYRVLKSNLKFAFGQRHLRYCNIGYNYRCNFKCEHCFADNFRGKNREIMTIDDHRKFACEAMDIGVWDFSFQGGEPFLPNNFELLKQIIPLYDPSKNLISVVTNGMYVTKEKLLELKNLGVDILTVSIDSGIEKEHDNFRGVKGSWKKAVESVDLALEIGMNVIVNTCVSHQNIKSDGLRKAIQFAESRGLLLNATLAVPIGRWGKSRNVTLTEEDWKYFRELQKKHSIFKRDLGFSFAQNGCGAVKEMIYVSAYGDVCPCPFIHISLGNVTEEPLKKIVDRALETRMFSSYPPKCLIAEDYEFLDDYLALIEEAKLMPLSFRKSKFLLGSKWDDVWRKVEKPTFLGKLSMDSSFKILKKFLSGTPRELRILDVGSGSGSSLKFFNKMGFTNTLGIDNSLEAVRRCKENNLNVLNLDAVSMPKDWEKRFDIVFSWGLLEHFSDYTPFVEEMARVSRQYVILVQPNLHSLYGKLITKITNLLKRGVDEYPYKIEQFIHAFSQNGFKLLERKSTPLREFEVLVFAIS